jgi:hypothetical protein
MYPDHNQCFKWAGSDQQEARQTSESKTVNTPPNLTGQWTGHYEQRGKEYPIAAHLVHDGVNLTGSMRDEQPERDYSLFEAAVQAGLPPGADERIDRDIRALVPAAPSAPIRALTGLHPDSRLVGRVEGNVVSFVKTYLGASFHGYKVGDIILGAETAGHDVQYQGKLSPDRQTIEGRWWIDADSSRGHSRCDGLFSLRRETAQTRERS